VLGKALGSTASGLSEFYGMFMGAGFRSKALDFDYTLLPYGELGNAHRFSISMRFGSSGAAAPGGKPSFSPVGGGGAPKSAPWDNAGARQSSAPPEVKP
ncbi:MAG: hypothetical protein HY922_10530, partial [Elusimicrobia bacterium]|nr:hypothetical protein [Elusimicrobiota bacterium]